MSKLFLTAAAAAFVTSIAHAEPAVVRIDDAARRAVVRFDDLDLNSPEGIVALEGRIRTAARLVCQAPPSMADLTAYTAYRGCVQDAKAVADSQADRAIAQARAVLVASDRSR